MPTTHPRTRLQAQLATVLTVLLALLASTAPASAVAAAKPAGPALTIETKTCNTGAEAAQRYIVLTASAVLRDAGDEVQMRFSVQSRPTLKATWRSVFAKTGDLGVWATSDAGADGLRYTKTINGLAEGNQYRVLVEARGIATGGKVVTKTTRKTYTCIQPQLTPHVVPVRATTSADRAGESPSVRTLVRNTGKQASAAVVVTIRDATTQGVIGQQTFPSIAGRATSLLTVPISACPGTIVITTQEQGAELTSLTPDQSLTVECPQTATVARR